MTPPRIVRGPVALQPDSAPVKRAPLTYEPFYGLSEKPFGPTPETKFVYHSASHDGVMQDFIDALGRGDSIMLLTGESGIGKTMLCRSLIEQLGRRTVTSFIADSAKSVNDLLRTVLVDFGVVARDDVARGRLASTTGQELISAIGDFAASLAPLHASAIIIVDEAQAMPPDVLLALSALSDVPGVDRRVQIILSGEPTLGSLLHRSELREMERRIAVRCRLDPLTAEEVIGYVTHRLSIAGPNARVEFDEAAFAEIGSLTRGVPRLVNLLCDRALTRGYEASSGVIDVEMIAAAAADLELVPVRSAGSRIAGKVAMGFAFIALTLAGAALAAWIFWAQVSQLLMR